MKRDDIIWLVKSGGRILGPLSYDDVEKKLREKELQVIDEICEPTRRWQLIRDHRVFSPLLDQLRLDLHSSDEHTTDSGSLTASMTESLHGVNDDITEDIGEFQQHLKEIVYDNISESTKSASRPSAQGRFQAAGTINEAQLQREADKGARWMWWLTTAVLVTVGAAFGVKRFMQQRSVVPTADIASLGLALYSEGDYSSSIEILKKVHTADPKRKDVWFPLGAMLIVNEEQTIEGKRLVQKALDERFDAPAAGWTAMGLAQIQDGDLVAAQGSFTKALNFDMSYLPAVVNAGVIEMINKNYPTARQSYMQAISRGIKTGQVYIHLAVAAANEMKNSGHKEVLNAPVRLIKGHLDESADYQQEFRLVDLYLRLLKGDLAAEEIESQMRLIIDVDPQQTDDFRHPLLIARQNADWNTLGVWCQSLVEKVESAVSATLGAICLLRQGQPMLAKASIERAVQQAPKDALIQAAYAAILRAAGFGSEASVALGRAIELDRKNEYVLPVILQARFCQEREDYECANTYWLKTMQIDSRLSIAKVGLAQIYYAKKAKSEAQAIINEVSSTLSEYKPLLRLKRQMSSERGNL